MIGTGPMLPILNGDLQGSPIKSAKLLDGENSSFHKIRMRSSDSMVHRMISKDYHKGSYSPRYLKLFTKDVVHQMHREMTRKQPGVFSLQMESSGQ